MNLKEWLRETEKFEQREFFEPADTAAIENASREIGLPFPPQYREFLTRVGCASVGSESFIGLGGPQYLDVVWVTTTLRNKRSTKNFPKFLIPLRADGYGNYDAIDTSHPTDDGEFAIVEWRHEGTDADRSEVLTSGFFEWLESMLTLIRESGSY
jgi:cell wall assembly regulator SMI1